MKEKSYFESVGRRKTSIARVRITPDSKGGFAINDRTLEDYFPTKELQAKVTKPLDIVGKKYKITVKIAGGGISSQADAIALGIARAIVESDQTERTPLKKEKLLRRDGRAKERRKFGLKKARKAPQWSKR